MGKERQLVLEGFEQPRPSRLRLVGAFLRLCGGYNRKDFEMLADALPESWDTWTFPKPSTLVGKIRGVLSNGRSTN